MLNVSHFILEDNQLPQFFVLLIFADPIFYPDTC